MTFLDRETLIKIWNEMNNKISAPELVDSILHYLSENDESKWKFLLSDRMQLRIVNILKLFEFVSNFKFSCFPNS